MKRKRMIRPVFEGLTAQISERMKKVKSKNTKLELAMKSHLEEISIPYEQHPKLHGNPDFRISNTNLLIFCDSSFWHGRREKDLKGNSFRKNKAFWVAKLLYNKRRDQRINRTLRKQGWSVWRFWDTDVLKRPEYVKKRLKGCLSGT